MAKVEAPNYETIRAAVAGEAWAVEKVVACYSDEMDKLATIEQKQPDESIKRVIDEDMRQALVLKLIEAIPQIPIEKG